MFCYYIFIAECCHCQSSTSIEHFALIIFNYNIIQLLKMEEDDVDVVFEDSALFNYFQEIGINSSDYEHASKNEQVDVKMESENSIQKLRSYFAQFSLQRFENNEHVLKIQQYYVDYLNVILASNVLIEEDSEFLQHWKIDTTLPSNRHRFEKLFILAIILGALSAALDWNVHHKSLSMNITWILLCIMTCFMFLCYAGSRLWDHYRYKNRHLRNECQLRSFVASYTELVTIVKRAINLIQEFELVARGFTLVLPRKPVSQLEQGNLPFHSSYQHCLAMRNILHSCCEKSFMAFRNKTKDLLQRYHLTSGIDHDSHYLATMPIEEFTSCVDTFLSQETDVSKRTISVAAIKTEWQFCLLQMSEFVRRFSLCFYLELCEDRSTSIFDDVADLLSPLQIQMSAFRKQIKQSYKFHKSLALNMSCPKKSIRTLKANDCFQSLQVAVHSLVLHLQSALSRSVALDTQVESIRERFAVNGQLSNGHKDDFHSTVAELMESVKLEIHSSLSCYDESAKHFDEAFVKKLVHEEEKLIAVLPTSVLKDERGKPVHLFEIGDPVIEDQVFEAVVTDEKFMQCDADDDDIIDQERKKQESEYSKNVLHELKSILSVKADERRRREEIALAKTVQSNDERQEESDSLLNVNKVESTSEEVKPDDFLTNTSQSKSIDEFQTKILNSVESDCTKVQDGTSPCEASDTCNTSANVHDNADILRRRKYTYNVNEGDELLETSNFPQDLNFNFSASVAALAVAKSKNFSGFSEQTFGDTESDTESDDDDDTDNR